MTNLGVKCVDAWEWEGIFLPELASCWFHVKPYLCDLSRTLPHIHIHVPKPDVSCVQCIWWPSVKGSGPVITGSVVRIHWGPWFEPDFIIFCSITENFLLTWVAQQVKGKIESCVSWGGTWWPSRKGSGPVITGSVVRILWGPWFVTDFIIFCSITENFLLTLVPQQVKGKIEIWFSWGGIGGLVEKAVDQ
jgi:hypothetical protein